MSSNPRPRRFASSRRPVPEQVLPHLDSATPSKPQRPPTRLRPICPTTINFGYAGALIADPNWWMQEKFPGQHLLICKLGATAHGIDAGGAVVPLPTAVREAAERLPQRCILEGVCSGDIFTVFDLPQFDIICYRSVPYSVRLAGLRRVLHAGNPYLPIAETATEFGHKVEMLRCLRAGQKRGLVLKKVNGVARRGDLAIEGYALQCAFPKD